MQKQKRTLFLVPLDTNIKCSYNSERREKVRESLAKAEKVQLSLHVVSSLDSNESYFAIKREGFNEPGKVMGHTIYLHQQGICGRTGLLVNCTIGNNCVTSASKLPRAIV